MTARKPKSKVVVTSVLATKANGDVAASLAYINYQIKNFPTWLWTPLAKHEAFRRGDEKAVKVGQREPSSRCEKLEKDSRTVVGSKNAEVLSDIGRASPCRGNDK
jgi:hypothetical protein